jgi:hypothetical protein
MKPPEHDPAAMPVDPAPVASPCIDICVMSEKTGLCEGCLRTLDEIAGWGQASEIGRAHV